MQGTSPWNSYRTSIKYVKFEKTVNANYYINHLFSNCTNLIEVDFTNFNTSSTYGMWGVFNECGKLEKVTFGNSFYTSNVKILQRMFYNCKKLKTINLGSNFNTANVIHFSYMFYGCESLESINFGNNFKATSAYNFEGMFAECKSLASLDLGSNFSTSQSSPNMNGMFYACESLTYLNVGGLGGSGAQMDNTFLDMPNLNTLVIGKTISWSSSYVVFDSPSYWKKLLRE